MLAGIFLRHGQTWQTDTAPGRQYGQGPPSLEGGGKDHFPCHLRLMACPLLPTICYCRCSFHPENCSLSAHFSILQRQDKTRSKFLLEWTAEEIIYYSGHQPSLSKSELDSSLRPHSEVKQNLLGVHKSCVTTMSSFFMQFWFLFCFS